MRTSRKIWIALASLLALLISGAIAIRLAWPRIEARMVGIHQKSVTQSLAQWGRESTNITDDTSAVAAAEMIGYIKNYYSPGPGYHGPADVEAALEAQRQKSILQIADALERYTGISYGTNAERWSDWAEHKKGNTNSYSASAGSPTAASDAPRVVKVSFCEQQGTCRIRINQQPVEKIKNTEFTNVITKLQLDYGDIVVWEAQRDERGKELSHPGEISKWWFKYIENRRMSFYSINSDESSDFFKMPIYHWKAPPAKPRPLNEAAFFVDGVSLGKGASGFQAMMDSIDRKESGPVFIMAPRIKNEGQASPWIAADQLSAWAEDSGIRTRFEKILFSRYAEVLDFGRFVDPEN